MIICLLVNKGGNRILMVSYISRKRQKEPLYFTMWGSERHAQKDFVSLRGFVGYVEIEFTAVRPV